MKKIGTGTEKLENRYILVAIHCFTKRVAAYTILNQEAATVADVMIKDFISRFGLPLELCADRGHSVESGLFRNLCNPLGIRKTGTAVLLLQSDGLIERMNISIRKYLFKPVSTTIKVETSILP